MKILKKIVVIFLIVLLVIGAWFLYDFLNKSNDKIIELENKIIKLEEENKKIVDELKNELNNINKNVIDENEKKEETQDSNTTIEIIKKVSPSGWSGAASKELQLYSNGDVYCITYNGEGKEEENILRKDLIAKNATDILGEQNGPAVETVIIKGKNVEIINDENSWIIFE